VLCYRQYSAGFFNSGHFVLYFVGLFAAHFISLTGFVGLSTVYFLFFGFWLLVIGY
jgi:hypothetical protein